MPAPAAMTVPPRIIVSMPSRGPRRTETKLPAMSPPATAPKHTP